MSSNTVEIREITFTRNGRDYTMEVEVTWHACGDGFAWIKKADGKPFFGTTGYYNATPGQYGRHDPTVILSYRGKVLAENVQGLAKI